MNFPSSLGSRFNAIPTVWRQRLILLFIIFCFVVPLISAWWLVGRWRPSGSAEHGQLLNPAQTMTHLRFAGYLEGRPSGKIELKGAWTLIYPGSARICDESCQKALYNMRQVRLALGKDMGRVRTLLVLDELPENDFHQWLAAEHPAMTVGIATDTDTLIEFARAYSRTPDAAQNWIYLLDPLGNLLMRYPVTANPRGILKDLQRLLRLSKIG